MGTVTFDGVGGTDNQTDLGGSGDSYLTSFQAFAPIVSDPSSPANSTKAPDTGFGEPLTNSLNKVLLFNIAAVTITGGSVLLKRKLQKR